MSDLKKNSSDNICAIIVTYNPVLENVKNLLADIESQVNKIIIVDNGSENSNELLDICKEMDFIITEILSENFGIAFAQNAGVKIAKKNGADFVIYFDQDSSVPEHFVQILKQSFLDLSNNYKIAATVPIFKDSRFGFYYPLIVLGRFGLRTKILPTKIQTTPFPISLAISSGTFTSISVLDDIGQMRNDFFIDYVDTEWCLRALSKGYSLYAIPSVCMLHAIGDNSILILKWRIPVHSAFRRYYRIRNAFFLLRLSHVPKLLAIREIAFNFAHQIFLIVTQGNRFGNLKTLIKALKDGLRG